MLPNSFRANSKVYPYTYVKTHPQLGFDVPEMLSSPTVFAGCAHLRDAA